MISAQPNKPVQEKLIAKLMEMPNSAVCYCASTSVILLVIHHVIKWDSLMSQAAAGGIEVLGNSENLKILSNVLKTNVSAAKSIGQFFTPQLGRIYMDMLGLYRAVSGIINETVAAQGTVLTRGRSPPY